jgi:hypothetical protein
MAKELRTALQLSGMIASALGVKEVDIQVRYDQRVAADSSLVTRRSDWISKAS